MKFTAFLIAIAAFSGVTMAYKRCIVDHCAGPGATGEATAFCMLRCAKEVNYTNIPSFMTRWHANKELLIELMRAMNVQYHRFAQVGYSLLRNLWTLL
ncbi:hypothetical protein MGYG_08238 [Nannizzia gypsea CBS 118893]|uniref:Extracellular membrane protein CFEM domain-containing protein n=1 Tax=Arthroderma gypseum (strain ATCC MYA-4604 / CBS 118893) TaxID=535722 RepID=E4V643_ARTGP|nr:hypothetical protein MGYG_08238 [Nannizzia gypsea CBS 118893]EFR05226.1 hypothetical protein MGYG_08238 [Nannizzia gypsea CBS 118893]